MNYLACLATLHLVLSCLALLVALVLSRQPHRPNAAKDKYTEPIAEKWHNYKGETGQFSPGLDRGRTDSLTEDDIQWAQELGAQTNEEIEEMVNNHRRTENGK